MCTLCRGVLCTEPLTPIQGVNLLHLQWVLFWYSEMEKGDPWKLKAAIPQGELTIMARVSFQISSIESAAQYAEYQMVRTKLPQIFPFNPLGPTVAHRCPPWAFNRVYISHKSVALPNWWPEIFLRYIDFVARQMIFNKYLMHDSKYMCCSRLSWCPFMMTWIVSTPAAFLQSVKLKICHCLCLCLCLSVAQVMFHNHFGQVARAGHDSGTLQTVWSQATRSLPRRRSIRGRGTAPAIFLFLNAHYKLWRHNWQLLSFWFSFVKIVISVSKYLETLFWGVWMKWWVRTEV